MRQTHTGRAPLPGPRADVLARDIALVALALGALSGLALAAFFDPHAPYRSVSAWLLADPVARFARNAHYWAAQACAAAALWYAWRSWRSASAARRAALALVFGAPLLLSGFALRGDADAAEVVRVLVLLAGPIAPGEPAPAAPSGGLLFGIHGVAALVVLAPAAVALWRRRWPQPRRAVAVAAGVVGAALFASPGLHDGLDPLHEGPWYFLGLQRIVEWGIPLALILAVAALALAAALLLVALPGIWTTRARALLAAVAGAYLAVCVVGLATRGEDGAWTWRLMAARGDVQLGWALGAPLPVRGQTLPVVRGRVEGCLFCHDRIDGLGASHAPGRIGCASCHGGDPFASDADRAHARIVRVPGNLADARRTCGQAGCHVAIAPRVERSIMTTMAGVVAVNRRVIGLARGEAPPDPAHDPLPHASRLGRTAADHHLRELCVSCHLGQPKDAWGPIGEASRGGGCNACHLVYDERAASDLARYLARPSQRRRSIPQSHPALTVNPGNEHCFGCHSRSSRISASYEGWHELRGAPPAGGHEARLRKLEDGREFEHVTPDVHHERGLECIDCHTANDLMGSGAPVARKTDQLRIGCADCHTAQLASIGSPDDTSGLHTETRTLLALRGWTLAPGQRLGATRAGEPLVNVVVDIDGRGRLRRKRTGEWLTLKAPLPVCTGRAGHARLSCISCHSAWAPRCPTCHTRFDASEEGYDHVDRKWVQGTWEESSGPFAVAPPTLGIRVEHDADGRARETVTTFVPGMILTFDRNRDPRRQPDPIFRRLYGLTFAHTIRRQARSCASCHADPVALGYGRGSLRYEVAGGVGRWRFTPSEPPSPHDGLPADAWIGFLRSRDDMVSTRDDVRPFTIAEQQRILRVGACLRCHAGESRVMRAALTDFAATMARRSPRCVLPRWP